MLATKRADRRSGRAVMADQLLHLGNLTIDLDGCVAFIDQRRVDLTFSEFELLTLLARNPGKVISRERLLKTSRGSAADRLGRKLNVHISRLRRKLMGSQPWSIQTVR